MLTEFQLSGYIHACTDEIHSLAYLQDLIPTLAAINYYRPHKLAKVGINSCRFARELCFICACMNVTT